MLCAQCLSCMISLSEGITLPQYEHRSWPGGRGEGEGEEEEEVEGLRRESISSNTGACTGGWWVVRRVWPEWNEEGDS